VTPWGLRSRLKKALGRAPAEVARERISVSFALPSGAVEEVQCEPRYSLVMASQALDTPIATGCPDGTCGGCVVEILEGGGLAEAGAKESALLKEKGVGEGMRLACHARVIAGGARVRVRDVWTMESVRGE
jgi:ferredoxin